MTGAVITYFLLSALLGGILGSAGITMRTWTFWALVLVANAMHYTGRSM